MTEAGTFPLPANLPVPEDTGACVHLPGHPMPPLIELASTAGGVVDLFLLSLSRPVLVFVYPRTASPGEEVPESWNALPGARGCTPELCSIRDGLHPLVEHEPTLAIFGLSVQPTAIQQEAATRLRLPYALLSDESLALQKALDLPTLQWQGRTFLQRVTLLLKEGQITQVHYPVFPPDKAAAVALQMLNGSRHACVPESCEEADGEAEVAEAE
ncbi:BcpB protein, partial [Acaromyces ingoldii]